jgi:uncharacterized phage infection (PIP) family protein YhgE
MWHDGSTMDGLLELEMWPGISRHVLRRWLDAVRLFTVLATIVALIGVGVSIAAYRQMGRTQASAQEQLRLIGRTTAQSSQTLRSVADASTQGAATVDSATTSIKQVSTTIRDTAGTIESTAGVFNFAIPITNSHPLAGVETSIQQEATQLRAVSNEIDQTGTSLASNSGNLRTIAQQVQATAQNTDAIANQIMQLADGPGSGSVPDITRSVRLILIWSVVLHLLILGFAISFYILATALRQLTYDAPRIRSRDDAATEATG